MPSSITYLTRRFSCSEREHLLLVCVMTCAMATSLPAAPPGSSSRAETDKAWKYEVEIISDGQYRVSVYQAMDSLVCDKQGRLWLRLRMAFPDEKNKATDFYWPRVVLRQMVSDDQGLTWGFTDVPRPVSPDTRSVLSDGTIVQTGSHCWPTDRWERYPRSVMSELRSEGRYVVDLGEKEDYCAIIYDLWMRRSRDDGKTWVFRKIHTQLPFFAHFVEHKFQRVLADGTILVFCYGRPEPDGPSNSYVLRSRDQGDTWELVMMADAKHAPDGQRFSEPYPVVYPDGRIMTLVRTGLGRPAYIVRSDDGGKTWTGPEPTPIISKHPTVTPLSDGTIVCTYPRRFARPYGVRARLTSDMGRTWSDEVVLADNFEIGDGLAFPITVELPDKTLYTVMHGKRYVEKDKVQSFVFGARWTRSYTRPETPPMPVPPRRVKFNEARAKKNPWEWARKGLE